MADEVITYRHSPSRAFNLGFAGVVLFIAIGGAVTYGDDPGLALVWGIPVASFSVPFLLMAVRQRVEVSSESLVAYVGATRTTRVRWSDIRRVDRGTVPESARFRHPHYACFIELNDGERVRLPVPGRDDRGFAWLKRCFDRFGGGRPNGQGSSRGTIAVVE